MAKFKFNKYIQSISGYILEISEGNPPKRMTLEEIYRERIKKEVITNRKKFLEIYKAEYVESLKDKK